MNKKSNRLLFFVFITAVMILISQLVPYVGARDRDYYYDIRQNQQLFGQVYEAICLRYAEVIDPDKFIRAGINGMLSELDPYTVFIEKEDNAELKIMTKGKYGGLGMRIIKREGFPTVIEPPMVDTPAEKVGIREGDQIIEVDGRSTKKLSVSETAGFLRGTPGTKVSIKVKRAGEPEPQEFHLIRAVILVRDITYKDIIQDSIGYIQLSHFSKDAGREVRQAIQELKLKGMKALILDLRGNPGGLLESAVAVTENFIPKDELVVFTKGQMKNSNQEYRSKMQPSWDDGPLVVLVDGGSASASEITAGAIQDLDRGVIIGSPTFGKGLVQTVVNLGDEADLKITSAKYFIPSGRLIQKADYFKKSDESVLFFETDSLEDPGDFAEADSEETQVSRVFKTRNERIVKEGDGIQPDLLVETPKFNSYRRALEQKSMFFGFAVEYSAKHPKMALNFEVGEPILNEFKKYLKEKEFDYKPAGFSFLEKFEEAMKEEPEQYAGIDSQILQIKQKVEAAKSHSFDANLDYVKTRLKTEIAAKIGGTKAKVESTITTDPVFQNAIETIHQPNKYYSILHTSGKMGD